jgi:hypothetical protein
MVCVYGALFLLALELLSGGPPVAIGAAVMFAVDAFILAFALTAGALAFVLDARRLCLPAASEITQRTKVRLILAVGATVLLPGVLLTVTLGARAWVPTVAILASALAGVLLPLVPTATILTLTATPLLAFWWTSAASPLASAVGRGALAVAAAVLTLLVIVRWRQVMQGDRIRIGSHWVLRWLPLSLSDEGLAYRRDSAFAVLPHHSEPDAPEAVIRIYLGPPFAFSSLRRRIVEAVIALLALCVQVGVLEWVYAGGSWHWRSNWEVTWPWLIALAWTVVTLPYLSRLQRLKGRGTSDLSELALTPGLGNARAQRGSLYRAVCAAPVARLMVVCTLAAFALLLGRSPAFGYVQVALWLIAVLVSYVIQIQATFGAANRDVPRGTRIVGGFLMMFELNYLGALFIVSLRHAPQVLILALWLVVIAVLLVVSAYLGRRLANRPHPFLA